MTDDDTMHSHSMHSHDHSRGGCGCNFACDCHEHGSESLGREDYSGGIGNSTKPFGGPEGMVPLLIRSGASWGPGDGYGNPGGNVTYSFAPPSGGSVSMSPEGRATMMEAFRVISDVADITFSWADSGDVNTINSTNGDIDISYYEGRLGGVGGWVGYGREGAWQIVEGFVDVRGVDLGLYIHEAMHAIGVSHPGEYDGQGFNYTDDAPFWDDTGQYTLMSYWSEWRTGAEYYGETPSTPMLYDIAALQAMYGANTTTRAGDTVYGFNSNAVRSTDGLADTTFQLTDVNDDMVASIWDAGGTDTIDLSGYSSASTIDLREGGFSSFNGLQKNLSIAYGAQIENAVGGSGNDTITGNALANFIDGGAGADTVLAGAGADRVVLTAGDTFFGDVGSDTGIISGFSRSEAKPMGWNGRNTVDQVAVGRYAFSSVENLEFLDGTLLTGNAAQVQRLYDTVFSRDADAGGLASWTNALDAGASVAQIATSFVASPEFTATYGSLDTGGFVTLLYRNVLDRAPDQGGFDNWTGRIDRGELSRADVVAGFSESAEHVAGMASGLALGSTWMGNANAEAVARLYAATFQRAPDEGGLTNWLVAMNGGTTRSQAAEGFAASSEFQTTYGSLDNGAFVDLMYRNVLNRDADAGGRANWTGALDNGALTRGLVLDGFAQSGEFVARLESTFDDGIVLA